MKKKYKLRVRGRFLNTKLLGEECSAPPWLALLQKRWQLNRNYLFPVSARLYLKLPFVLVALAAVLFVLVYVGIISVLQGLAIISPVFLVWVCACCVSRVRACIMADDVRCYLARVKNYHKPYASIEFSNGHIEKRLFVYTADEKPIKPGDEVYVCVIGDEILQFCEVRPARKLGKMPNRNPKKEKKIEKEEATCQINRKRKYVLEKKKFESRAGGKMLDLKQLGKECSVPPGIALLEKRQQITEDGLGKIALLISILRFALPFYVTAFFYAIVFSTLADSVSTLLKGLAIAVPFLLLLLYATRVFRRRNCIQAGDVRCYIARGELLGNKLPSFLNTRSHAPCAILFSRVSGSYRCFLYKGYASMKRCTHAVDKCELSPLSQRLHWFMVIVGTFL